MNLSSIKPNFSTANTANTLVQRDAGGDIFVGDIFVGDITATTFTGKLAPAVITGETAITDAASDDVVLLYDTSANGVRKITIDNLMRKINNVPYLEYAWVTSPNAGAQTISHGIWNVLNLTHEIADTGNFGSLASNQITLAAGTYRFMCHTNLVLYYAAQTVFALYNVTDGTYISTISDQALANYGGSFEGQFIINSQKVIDFRLGYSESGGRSAYIREDNGYGHGHAISTANSTHRTSVKLWKVG